MSPMDTTDHRLVDAVGVWAHLVREAVTCVRPLRETSCGDQSGWGEGEMARLTGYLGIQVLWIDSAPCNSQLSNHMYHFRLVQIITS